MRSVKTFSWCHLNYILPRLLHLCRKHVFPDNWLQSQLHSKTAVPGIWRSFLWVTSKSMMWACPEEARCLEVCHPHFDSDPGCCRTLSRLLLFPVSQVFMSQAGQEVQYGDKCDIYWNTDGQMDSRHRQRWTQDSHVQQQAFSIMEIMSIPNDQP